MGTITMPSKRTSFAEEVHIEVMPLSDLPADVSATEVLQTFPVCGADVRYEKVAHIGQGSYANVYLVVSSRSGRQYVLKEMDALNMTEQERGKALREVRILHTLKHPNIIGYKDSYLDDEGFLCIIMEYADGGDIHQLLQVQKHHNLPFEESTLLHWVAQILLALKHVHDHNALHRDLKPQNLFVTQSGMIKLGDFGVSRILESESALAKTQTGTPFYFSPELWLDKPYDKKSDMFALGAIMYELCMHVPPFHYEDMNLVKEGTLNDEPFPIPPIYSTELRSLIDSMMSKRPEDRPSCDQILNLPFLRKEVLKLPWGRAQTTPATMRPNPGNKALMQSKKIAENTSPQGKVRRKKDKGKDKEKKEKKGKDKKEKKERKDKREKKHDKQTKREQRDQERLDILDDAIMDAERQSNMGATGPVDISAMEVEAEALMYAGGLAETMLGQRTERSEAKSMDDILREALEDAHRRPQPRCDLTQGTKH